MSHGKWIRSPRVSHHFPSERAIFPLNSPARRSPSRAPRMKLLTSNFLTCAVKTCKVNFVCIFGMPLDILTAFEDLCGLLPSPLPRCRARADGNGVQPLIPQEHPSAHRVGCAQDCGGGGAFYPFPSFFHLSRLSHSTAFVGAELD